MEREGERVQVRKTLGDDFLLKPVVRLNKDIIRRYLVRRIDNVAYVQSYHPRLVLCITLDAHTISEKRAIQTIGEITALVNKAMTRAVRNIELVWEVNDHGPFRSGPGNQSRRSKIK